MGKRDMEREGKVEKPTFFVVSGSTKGTGALVIGKSLIVDRKNSSQGASNNIPCPTLPLRPVLPSRCIYCCLSAGMPTCEYNKTGLEFKTAKVAKICVLKLIIKHEHGNNLY